jgi:hypothetical protein
MVVVDGAEIAESIYSPSHTRKLPVWCGKHLGRGIAYRQAFRVCHPDIQMVQIQPLVWNLCIKLKKGRKHKMQERSFNPSLTTIQKPGACKLKSDSMT